MPIEIDPASQTTGLVKWGTTVAAGYLAAKSGLDLTTATGIVAAVFTLASGAWQVIHRLKAKRAIAAAAALPSNASESTVKQAAAAA